MSISRQNSERLGGGGAQGESVFSTGGGGGGGGGGGPKGEIVFSTGRVRSVCAQEVLFCIVSPPHKL